MSGGGGAPLELGGPEFKSQFSLESIWGLGEALIHVVHRYLLRIYLVPNTVLGTVDTVVNETV